MKQGKLFLFGLSFLALSISGCNTKQSNSTTTAETDSNTLEPGTSGTSASPTSSSEQISPTSIGPVTSADPGTSSVHPTTGSSTTEITPPTPGPEEYDPNLPFKPATQVAIRKFLGGALIPDSNRLSLTLIESSSNDEHLEFTCYFDNLFGNGVSYKNEYFNNLQSTYGWKGGYDNRGYVDSYFIEYKYRKDYEIDGKTKYVVLQNFNTDENGTPYSQPCFTRLTLDKENDASELNAVLKEKFPSYNMKFEDYFDSYSYDSEKDLFSFATYDDIYKKEHLIDKGWSNHYSATVYDAFEGKLDVYPDDSFLSPDGSFIMTQKSDYVFWQKWYAVFTPVNPDFFMKIKLYSTFGDINLNYDPSFLISPDKDDVTDMSFECDTESALESQYAEVNFAVKSDEVFNSYLEDFSENSLIWENDSVIGQYDFSSTTLYGTFQGFLKYDSTQKVITFHLSPVKDPTPYKKDILDAELSGYLLFSPKKNYGYLIDNVNKRVKFRAPKGKECAFIEDVVLNIDQEHKNEYIGKRIYDSGRSIYYFAGSTFVYEYYFEPTDPGFVYADKTEIKTSYLTPTETIGILLCQGQWYDPSDDITRKETVNGVSYGLNVADRLRVGGPQLIEVYREEVINYLKRQGYKQGTYVEAFGDYAFIKDGSNSLFVDVDGDSIIICYVTCEVSNGFRTNEQILEYAHTILYEKLVYKKDPSIKPDKDFDLIGFSLDFGDAEVCGFNNTTIYAHYGSSELGVAAMNRNKEVLIAGDYFYADGNTIGYKDPNEPTKTLFFIDIACSSKGIVSFAFDVPWAG